MSTQNSSSSYKDIFAECDDKGNNNNGTDVLEEVIETLRVVTMILLPRIFHREWLLLIHVGVISGVLDIRGDPVVTEVILDTVCLPSSSRQF